MKRHKHFPTRSALRFKLCRSNLVHACQKFPSLSSLFPASSVIRPARAQDQEDITSESLEAHLSSNSIVTLEIASTNSALSGALVVLGLTGLKRSRDIENVTSTNSRGARLEVVANMIRVPVQTRPRPLRRQ